jgi:hypothetical protein
MERRAPSWEFIVFCRDTGANEDEEDVEALEGACSVATDMSARKGASSGYGQDGSHGLYHDVAKSRAAGRADGAERG